MALGLKSGFLSAVDLRPERLRLNPSLNCLDADLCRREVRTPFLHQ
jgi:hypothetical protein